jgi:CRP-like cAMP-binding protein
MVKAAQPLIANLELHDDLSEEERSVLLNALGPEREVAAGADMIRQGDRLWHSTVLLAGFAIRYQVHEGGAPQITAIHVPGDFIDLHSFLLKTMDHSVAALTDCTYATVSHDILKDITATRPHLTRLLWLKTVIDGAMVRNWLAVTGSLEPRERAAHLICEIFIRLRNVGRLDDESFTFPLSKNDQARMMGFTGSELGERFKQLSNEGLIDWSPNAVTVKKWDQLKEVARFDRTYLALQHEPR